MSIELKSNAPGGDIATRWDRHRFEMKLVNPANKRKYKVIVVGSGLAGGAAAATLAELGYDVDVLLLPGLARAARTRSPRRAASTPRRTTRTTATSIHRLFYDTVKGGDFRAREANVYRLAEVCVEHHRPVRGAGRAVRARVRRHARQPLASAARRCRARSTRAARPASSCCSAPTRRSSGRSAPARSRCSRAPRCSTSSSIERPRARHRHARPGHRRRSSRTSAHAVVLATGGYGNVFYLSTNAKGCNVTATWRALQARRRVRQPLLHADPPDLHPGQRATTSPSSR